MFGDDDQQDCVEDKDGDMDQLNTTDLEDTADLEVRSFRGLEGRQER